MIRNLTILAACILPLCAHAQFSNTIAGAKITQVGIFKARAVNQASVQSGWKADGADNVSWVQSTTNIPARVGIQFGFRYNIIGSPTNTPLALQVVHVQPQFRDPKTGATSITNTTDIQSRIGQSYLLYTLENADLIPGKWRFELFHEGKKLCEQGFMVGTITYPARPIAHPGTNAAPKTSPQP
jgi:hypothetical protein